MGGAGGSGTMGTAGAAGDPYTEDEGCATGTTFPACATAKRTLAGGAAGGMGGNFGSLLGWIPNGEPDHDDPDLVNRIF